VEVGIIRSAYDNGESGNAELFAFFKVGLTGGEGKEASDDDAASQRCENHGVRQTRVTEATGLGYSRFPLPKYLSKTPQDSMHAPCHVIVHSA